VLVSDRGLLKCAEVDVSIVSRVVTSIVLGRGKGKDSSCFSSFQSMMFCRRVESNGGSSRRWISSKSSTG